MKPQRLLTEQLELIRNTDEMAGVDLQTSPLAWQQRRLLLGHIAALEQDIDHTHQLTLQLCAMLEPVSAGAVSLDELVPRVRAVSTPGVRRCPHGYNFAELADGSVICEVCSK